MAQRPGLSFPPAWECQRLGLGLPFRYSERKREDKGNHTPAAHRWVLPSDVRSGLKRRVRKPTPNSLKCVGPSMNTSP